MNAVSYTNKRAEPPGQRTQAGQAFTAANRGAILSLQHCNVCNQVQYPPRELCQHCLADALQWRATDPTARLLSSIDLHHSLEAFYQHHINRAPWPIASVKLHCGAILFAHTYLASFAARSAIASGTRVAVFSHGDLSQQAVLIAVARGTPIKDNQQRTAIARNLGLLEPPIKTEGI